MGLLTGFQSNTTITAGFWIYRPDPTADPVSKETFVEVNSLQYVEANAALIISSIASTQVSGNVVTVTVASAAQMRSGQVVILSGLTSSTFLNGQLLTVTGLTPTSFNASFVHSDYAAVAEAAGAIVTDTTSRMCDLYYAATSLATTQQPRKLEGAVAARFLYDMESLFA